MADSNEAAEYLLKHGDLTADERLWVSEFGRALFPVCGRTAGTRLETVRAKYG